MNVASLVLYAFCFVMAGLTGSVFYNDWTIGREFTPRIITYGFMTILYAMLASGTI